MVINQGVQALYGTVHNLRPFVHPEYKRRFRFMTPKETVNLAEQILDRILASGLSTVIVSESGASPLVWICRQLAERRGVLINWQYLKIPRDPLAHPFPVIMAYLSEAEQKLREKELKVVCSKIRLSENTITLSQLLHGMETIKLPEHARRIATILKGTRIQSLFSSPFLFFDEYIDSGTTLANAVRYALYFAGTLRMQTGCYYVNVDIPSDYRAVSFALHSRNSKQQCFEQGVYPFENRIDLIGYWYTSSDTMFRKTYVSDLIYTRESDVSPFMACLICAADDPILLEKIRNNMHIQPVREYCRREHIMQYILYRIEAELGVSAESTEFLYQLFEMYAPIWSPLPDEYHIDFVSAFNPDVVSQQVSSLMTEYQENRSSLLSAVARACEARRAHWRSLITHLIIPV